MVNPAFLLSGLGMMLVGIAPVLWWRYRTLVPWKDFWLGVVLWMAAIGTKIVMDLTVTGPFLNTMGGIYTTFGIAIISGAYVGLRTGILESGLTYIAGIKSRIKKFDFEQAVALGLAFGCAEAFFIGITSFINTSVIFVFPQMLNLMTAAQKASVLQQLSLPSIAAVAPVIERLSVVAVHAFCSILVIYTIKRGRARYFMVSFLARVLLDGTLPLLTYVFDKNSIEGIYSIEAFVAAMGIFSLAGILWMRSDWRKTRKKRDCRGLVLIGILISVLFISVAAVVLAQPSVASKLERRQVDFDAINGKYDFMVNGSSIGSSEFRYAGGTEHEGVSLFIIEEEANLSGSDYEMYIAGTLHVTVDARPVFYNSTIIKNGEKKEIFCTFHDTYVEQNVTVGNETSTIYPGSNSQAFVIANNMISHWALLFRAAKLEPKNTYVTSLYSPNAEALLSRSLEVTGIGNVTINGRVYEAYIFSDLVGNFYYVTPEGRLLKVENTAVEVVESSDDLDEAGGIFR